MPENTKLEDILQAQLGWHKARVKFVALFIIVLIKVCTVNFVKIANGLSGKPKRKSNYRRIQRFFLDLKSIIAISQVLYFLCCPRKKASLLPLTQPTGNLVKRISISW